MMVISKQRGARARSSSTVRIPAIPLPITTSCARSRLLMAISSFGGRATAVAFADHVLRKHAIGGRPCSRERRRPLRAQPVFQRPQQRPSDRSIVFSLHAVSNVTFGKRARRRQDGGEIA